MIKKIAQKIGDREATIEIGIADHFSNGDRDRDRDLNFGDRSHALVSSNMVLICSCTEESVTVAISSIL